MSKKSNFGEYLNVFVILLVVLGGGVLCVSYNVNRYNEDGHRQDAIKRLEEQLKVADTAVKTKAAELGIEPEIHSYNVKQDRQGTVTQTEDPLSKLHNLEREVNTIYPDTSKPAVTLTDKQLEEYNRLIDEYNRISKELTDTRLKR